MKQKPVLRRYHAPVWDEPLVMEMGVAGRRGCHFPGSDSKLDAEVGCAGDLVPASLRRKQAPRLPEMSEPDVLRHYLHLSQETLGMMGISLFGTCTMKYNPRLTENLAARPFVADLHPQQDPATMQGVLRIIHDFDRMLRELSGMDQFVFQPAGGADAAYTQACLTRSYFASRGELGKRNQIVTSIQSHPCNPATAAAAGFEVVTLALGEQGYPPLEALKAAVSQRTAALFINNPDDMGIYNPDIKEWVRLVHDAGGLCFYDHANFNGVMGKIRARELGFDACMFMLHKTFGAPKGGGGPAVGAYGCTAELAPFLPRPVVVKDDKGYHLDYGRKKSAGKIREFFGNVPQVLKAYAWLLAMGRDGIDEASDLSVLANNYMDHKLGKIRGLSRSNPGITKHRMEMTRWSLGQLKTDTGCGTVEVANRMADYGIDPWWMSHEPWIVPEPFTPEAGEMYSKEDLDYWIAVVAKISEEAYANPELVKSAPHKQAIAQIKGDALNDPTKWAITWRAYLRKHGKGAQAGAETHAAE